MIGQHVSHYRIVEKIGEGGMGVIYRAHDTRLRRSVVLKVLRRDRSVDREHRRRLLAEARAASSLDHPNIVTIHDVLTWRGSDVIVMEYVQGQTLRQLLAAGPLPITDALAYSVQVCDAVAAAHAAGVVHRDLKPGNIMVGANGVVKVLDFGIAKRTQWSESCDTVTAPSTRAGLFVGTPEYASPEQLAGLPTDTRSDVFSFGVLFYEMLAGRRPFGFPPMSGSQVSDGAPSVRTINPELPECVDGIVTHALARDPAQRTTSMAELARDIRLAQQVLRRAAHADARGIAGSRHGRWPRSIVWKAGVAAIAVLAALGAALYMWMDRAGRLERAAAPTGGSLAQASDEAFAMLRRYDRAGNIDGAIDRFQRVLAADAGSAPAYAGLSVAYWRKYRDGRDAAWIQPALSNAREAVARSPMLAAAHVALGFASLEGGDRTLARTSFDQAMTLDPRNADAHFGLGELLRGNGELRAAEVEYEKGLALRPDDWELQMLVGVVQFLEHRYNEAEAALQRAIRMSPDNPLPYRSLGAMYLAQGVKLDDAATLFQKSIAIRPEAGAYDNLGTLLLRKGIANQAVVAFEKAVELRANVYLYWANLGEACRRTGDREKSHTALDRAIQLLATRIERSPGDPTLRSRMALYRAWRGDAAGAQRELALIPDLLKRDASVLGRTILVHELTGRRTEALAVLERMIGHEYSLIDIQRDPDLHGLRSDVRYHRLMARVEAATARQP